MAKRLVQGPAAPVYLVDSATGEIIDSVTPLQVEGALTDSWRVNRLVDETAGDSDKTFVVPADTEYQILWVYVIYTSSGTAGNRQLVVEVQDHATKPVGQPARAGTTQAASITRRYMFGASLADLTGFRDTDWLSTPLPPTLVLRESDRIRVYDNAAIDAAGDNMNVYVQIAQRAV